MNWTAIIDRWNALAIREQVLLLLCLLSGIIIATISYLWEPLTQSRMHLQTENMQTRLAIDEIRHQIAELRQVRQQHKGVVKQKKRGESDTNRLLQDTAKDLGLSFDRFQPGKNQTVRVWFKNAQFNKVMRWLHEIEQNHGVSIARTNILNTKVSGKVDGQIHLEY